MENPIPPIPFQRPTCPMQSLLTASNASTLHIPANLYRHLGILKGDPIDAFYLPAPSPGADQILLMRPTHIPRRTQPTAGRRDLNPLSGFIKRTDHSYVHPETHEVLWVFPPTSTDLDTLRAHEEASYTQALGQTPPTSPPGA